ncbi:hypothetical protein BVX98_01970 [bacterium F11]|nr:hypothetical protein BVX98_01970 [bacterium F11]
MNVASILGQLQGWIGVVIVFGVVIFIHEFGHFIVAKKSGIKVEQFSFGFGPEIFGFVWGETRYTVNWIPLGGYVRMSGEFPEEYEGPVLEGENKEEEKKEPKDRSRDFMAKPWYMRIFVALAGPAMNYVLAVVVFFLIFAVWGEQIQINKTEVGEVIAGMPAEKAGLQMGDVILRIDGELVSDFGNIAEKIGIRGNKETLFLIQRGESELTLSITPQQNEEEKRGLIGIRPAQPVTEDRKISLPQSFISSVRQCWLFSTLTLDHLGKKIMAGEKPDVAGPIGIGQIIFRAVRTGFREFLFLIGLISVALGLFNLFPIPVLDGGHIAYYLVEGIRGKPVSVKVMGRANMVGFALLIMLLVFATYNDFTRKLPSPQKVTKSETLKK